MPSKFATATVAPRKGSSPSPARISTAAAPYTASRLHAPRTFVPAIDDPLLALQLEITGKQSSAKAYSLTGHGKPVGGFARGDDRRTPARRAAYRTPPR